MSQEIARLDEDGMIIAVEPCTPENYRTDPQARTVQLERGHDMRNRLRQYRYNWNGGFFQHLSQQVVDQEDRDADGELVEGLIEAVEDISEYLLATAPEEAGFALSERAQRVLRKFRRKRPNRRKRVRQQEGETTERTVTVGASARVVQP